MEAKNEFRSVDRRRGPNRHGRDRRGLREVHGVGRRKTPAFGCQLERGLVHALVFRGDQLHQQLGVRGVRDRRLVDRRLCDAQILSQRAQPSTGALKTLQITSWEQAKRAAQWLPPRRFPVQEATRRFPARLDLSAQ
jgi:hypothetical protein